MPEVLKALGLVKSYGGRVVVDHVNLNLRRGEIVGLLGSNGAGKTTSFRMVIGLVRPDEGEIQLDGRSITRQPMFRRCRQGIGYLAQQHSVFRGLTVTQNLTAVLEHLNLPAAEMARRRDDLLEALSLGHLTDSMAEHLSGGEKRRLEIARCLATAPSFLLLDEPFSGIDPKTVGEIQRIIQSLREGNIGILITDHSWRETLQVTQRSYIIHAGKVICHGDPETVMKDQRVRETYLGDSTL